MQKSRSCNCIVYGSCNYNHVVHCVDDNVQRRLVPIMILKLPIMLWSNAPNFACYAQIMLHMLATNSTFPFSYPT